MKTRSIQEMIRAKEQIERGAATPAKVWEVRSDGKGGFTRRAVDPKAFRRAQKAAWDKSIAATRQKLGLSGCRLPRQPEDRLQFHDLVMATKRHNMPKRMRLLSILCLSVATDFLFSLATG